MGGANCCSSREKRQVARQAQETRTILNKEIVEPPAPRPPCRFGDGCTRADPRHWCAESHPGDPDWPLDRPPAPPQVGLRPNLEAREGGFDWLRHANGPQDRAARCAAAAQTLQTCRARAYVLGGATEVRLRRVDELVAGTRLVGVKQVEQELEKLLGQRRSVEVPRLKVDADSTALEAALLRVRRGERVAVLSAASAYHPCGGFRTGGRHALEESICTQTTLPLSLQRALWLSRQPPAVQPPDRVLAKQDTTDWLCYIPDEGVVLSPCIEVFREGTVKGYRFLPEVAELAAVVSLAMPNLNQGVRDSPVDDFRDKQEYSRILRSKFQAALGACVLAGAQAVVIPGVGCGVFRNPPAEVGAALGEVLRWERLRGLLPEVVLAGAPQDLCDAAIRSLKAA